MRLSFLFIFLFSSFFATSQTDDLSMLLENESRDSSRYFTGSAFKTTRIVNGHSIENTPAGNLDFRVSHRFGRINSGAYEFFGLDDATMRLAFEYGIADWLMLGIGRSTHLKNFDTFTKIKLLRQSTGFRKMPLSVSYFASAELRSLKTGDAVRDKDWQSNLSFVHQLLIARKFNSRLSLQIMPTLVHWNLVPSESDPNDMLSLGMGGRYRVSGSVSINAEYYYQIPEYKIPGTLDAFSIGVDIETGGHVFQLMLSNALPFTEKGAITQTTGDWLNGDIYAGFTISRVFTLRKSGKTW